MPHYEASFEVDSRSDAHAVHRVLDGLHDAVREESGRVRAGSNDANDLLAAFAAMRDAAATPAPGTLTVTYERDDEATL